MLVCVIVRFIKTITSKNHGNPTCVVRVEWCTVQPTILDIYCTHIDIFAFSTQPSYGSCLTPPYASDVPSEGKKTRGRQMRHVSSLRLYWSRRMKSKDIFACVTYHGNSCSNPCGGSCVCAACIHSVSHGTHTGMQDRCWVCTQCKKLLRVPARRLFENGCHEAVLNADGSGAYRGNASRVRMRRKCRMINTLT